MSAVRIYMEGGGDRKDTKAALRTGMDKFLHELKMAVQAKRWKWKLTPCGSRENAYKSFKIARDLAKENEIIILLVDAEAPVGKLTSIEYLRRNEKQWTLTGVATDHVHLMVQTMETWILADWEKLKSYYGQRFDSSALPRTDDPESIAKSRIDDSLARATRHTKKKRYHKIWDAEKLLGQIDPAIVRRRCRHCKRLFDSLGSILIVG